MNIHMQVGVITTYFLSTLWICFNQTADEIEDTDQQGDTVLMYHGIRENLG